MKTDRELLQQVFPLISDVSRFYGQYRDLVKAMRDRLAEPEEPRPAVRLSDEEIDEIYNSWFINVIENRSNFVRAIEVAVLKKNGLEVKDE